LKLFSSADFDGLIAAMIAFAKRLVISPVSLRLIEDALKTDQGCCIDCVTTASNLSKNMVESQLLADFLGVDAAITMDLVAAWDALR
jgi:hypothetical protein